MFMSGCYCLQTMQETFVEMGLIKGIKSLIEIAKPFGKIIVVAPEVGNSGMSHALTIKTPFIYEIVIVKYFHVIIVSFEGKEHIVLE